MNKIILDKPKRDNKGRMGERIWLSIIPWVKQDWDNNYQITSIMHAFLIACFFNCRPNAAVIALVALGCIVVCLIGALIGLLFYFLKYKKRPKESKWCKIIKLSISLFNFLFLPLYLIKEWFKKNNTMLKHCSSTNTQVASKLTKNLYY